MLNYYTKILTYSFFWKNPLRAFLKLFHLIFILLTNNKVVLNVDYGNEKFKILASDFNKNQGGRSLLLFNSNYDNFLKYGHLLIDESDVIIDGGANQGVYSCAFAQKVGKNGKVIAVEPLKEPIKMLLENLKLNNFKNIKIERCGLWNKNSEGKIYFSKDRYGQATIVAKSENFQNLKLKKLDNLIMSNNLSKVDLVKLDLQGAEVFAINGALKSIKMFKPKIYLEANNDNFEKINTLLSSLKYKAYQINKNGSLMLTKKIKEETNILFLQNYQFSDYQNRILDFNYKNSLRKFISQKLILIKKIFVINKVVKKRKDQKLKEILMKNSKSELNQDIFVLDRLNFKKNGYFIDLGAADGVELSNTYLLEKKFNWRGVLCDANSFYEKNLKQQRSQPIENRVIYDKNTKVKFSEIMFPMLSSISSFASSDKHKKMRKKYLVKNKVKETISVKTFLKKYKCPRTIDYLSIDTEGSEYRILKAFDFKKYKVNVITVEHNYTINKYKIEKLLISQNFKLVDISSKQEGWYINNEIYNNL